ncbi:MAG: protein translocase SEC61 complex subunit gamma [Candidatus Woesearchaeota archaeon]
MSVINKLTNFITESKRVLRIAKKPSKEEYWTITKVSGLGLLLIGFAGFLLHMADIASTYLAVGVVFLIVLYLMFVKK